MQRPRVSFLLEVHNMCLEPIETIKELREYPDAEIIVIDDGSEHACTMAILEEMNGVNEFVIHANDLFVILTQNRAVGFARGEYVVKLQDDDMYPGTAWIDEALSLFDKHPDLAIVGGRGAIDLPSGWNFQDPLPWRPRAGQFQFVSAVNEAPMWIRRSAFLELGGFDEEFAPYYWGEQELCFRMWLAGKSVGWYNSGWKRYPTDLRLRIREKEALHRQTWRRNATLFGKKFASSLDRINEMVQSRNALEREESWQIMS